MMGNCLPPNSPRLLDFLLEDISGSGPGKSYIARKGGNQFTLSDEIGGMPIVSKRLEMKLR